MSKKQYNDNLNPILLPPAPILPELRTECSLCGFVATKSEYQEKHPYCLQGRLLLGGILVVCAIWIGLFWLLITGYAG